MGKACQARRGDSQYDPGDSGRARDRRGSRAMAIDRSRSRPAAESNRRGASGAENRGALWPEHSGRSVLGSLVLLLAALFAVWLLLPAVTAERNPPQDAERLGRDLSRGFRCLPWTGHGGKESGTRAKVGYLPIPEVRWDYNNSHYCKRMECFTRT